MPRTISSHSMPYIDLDLIIWIHHGPVSVKLVDPLIQYLTIARKRILSHQIASYKQQYIPLRKGRNYFVCLSQIESCVNHARQSQHCEELASSRLVYREGER